MKIVVVRICIRASTETTKDLKPHVGLFQGNSPQVILKSLSVLEIGEGSSNSQSCDADYTQVNNLRKLENSRSFDETHTVFGIPGAHFSKALENFRGPKAIFS